MGEREEEVVERREGREKGRERGRGGKRERETLITRLKSYGNLASRGNMF